MESMQKEKEVEGVVGFEQSSSLSIAATP